MGYATRVVSGLGNSLLNGYCYDYHLGVSGTFGDANVTCSVTASTAGDNGNVYQIINKVDNNRSQNYTYDSLNRIAQGYTTGNAPLATSWGEIFTIDAWGNLTNRSPVANKQNYEGLSVSASLKNQLTGNVHDSAGNLWNNGTYVYDAENRMTATAGKTYAYDGDGERVVKCTGTYPTCSGGTLYWGGAGTDALAESGATGTMSAEYFFYLGKRMARRDLPSGTVHYYLGDHLGSARTVTDATGLLTEQSDYSPYGGEMWTSGSDSNHYKFTGKERDTESGLDYFGARHYASSLGRFLSVDPVIVTPERKVDPQQFNRYGYVRNNPLRLVDLTGEILQLSGDLGADKADICQIVGDACKRVTVNDNGTVSFNTAGLDLTTNEGAALINQLVNSTDTYGYAVSATEETAAGSQSMANRVESNLDDRLDDRYVTGKNASQLPPKGVADQVTINPNEHYRDSQGRPVSESSIAFHELAEAYAKIDGGKPYSDFHEISVDNGTTLKIGPPQQGAHNEAVQRELKLREQRPNLQNSGRAGDQVIRDPHN